MPPFTTEQFFDVFEAYNLATSSVRWMLYALALICVGVIFYRNEAVAGKVTAAVLAALWAWTSGVYHFQFFTRVNTAAYLFGLIFFSQSLIFIVSGLIKGGMRFRVHPHSSTFAGIAMIGYTLVLYPLLGYSFGHTYPRAPTFGTPCPITIFTFGILMFLDRQPPIYLYAIPLAWSGIGMTAAYLFGIYEDLGLIVAAAASVFLIRRKPRQIGRTDAQSSKSIPIPELDAARMSLRVETDRETGRR